MNFFNRFPTILWSYNNKAWTKKRVRDLTKRLNLRLPQLNDQSAYYLYETNQTETPWQISYNVYGSARYTWVVMVMNAVVNPWFDWMFDDRAFENALNNTYQGQSVILDIDARFQVEFTSTGTYDVNNPHFTQNGNALVAKFVDTKSGKAIFGFGESNDPFTLDSSIIQQSGTSLLLTPIVFRPISFKPGESIKSYNFSDSTTQGVGEVLYWKSNLAQVVVDVSRGTFSGVDYVEGAGIDSNSKGCIGVVSDTVLHREAPGAYRNDYGDFVSRFSARLDTTTVSRWWDRDEENFYGSSDEPVGQYVRGPISNRTLLWAKEMGKARSIFLLKPEYLSLLMEEVKDVLSNDS